MQNLRAPVRSFLYGWLVLLLSSCQPQSPTEDMISDLLLSHAYVYPVTGEPIEDGAVAIREGKIIAIGPTADIEKTWKPGAKEIMDCQGGFLMPGFIEGHGHFSSLGMNLIELDLLETVDWQEIIDSVAARVGKSKPGEWIVGRGWHQEKWKTPIHPNVNGYPYHDALSRISPHNPVMLKHASGHSILANQSAMDAAGISIETPDPEGGRIVRDGQKKVLGVFEENAMEPISSAYHVYEQTMTDAALKEKWYRAIEEVQAHCLARGITTFEDMGSTFDEINRYKELALKDSLDIRLYVMLHHPLDELKGHLEGFPIIRAGHDMFTCRSIKAYIDGALGSYGAWLLQPYADKPGFIGQNTTPVADIKNIAELAITHDMQFGVHAIGDKGNRTVLDIFEETMKAHPEKKDLRWRIEHAQHIDPTDIPRFKALNVIASMQAIHCTSDAPFVVKRLGEERARTGAYPWRSLLDAGVVVANGTDAPVERVDPIPNFYASVTRRRADTGQVFFPEQAMTREEALYSMTMANAYAAFEEDIKGSIEAGKWADLVLLSNNLFTCQEDSILQTQVLMTMVGGKMKYKK